jgi:hypothetical protein
MANLTHPETGTEDDTRTQFCLSQAWEAGYQAATENLTPVIEQRNRRIEELNERIALMNDRIARLVRAVPIPREPQGHR